MNSNLLEKAILIAAEAHKGQTDKAGQPYILHLTRVMLKGETDEEKICGILHDILEDTNYTKDQLINEGFSENVINAIEAVTKVDGENYQAFIDRIAQDKLAIKVKLNDLEDNMDVKRLKTLTEKDAERITKYIRSYDYLKNKL